MAPKKRKYDEAESFVNCPVRGCKMRVDEANLQAHILEKHAKSQAAREIKEKQALAKGPPCGPCAMEVSAAAAPVAPATSSTAATARREADSLAAFAAPWRIELFDLSDGNLCGTFMREALAVEGRPSYKSDSGRRIRWKQFKSLRSGCWQLLSAKGRLDAFSETTALTPVEDLVLDAWKMPSIGSFPTKPMSAQGPTMLQRILELLLFAATRAQFPGADLPFPPMPSEAVVGPTLADSKNSWPAKRQTLKKDAPNIVVIMNDDVGFGAPDTFGGPIHTPTLSKVASRGVSYNRFHTTAICSPTRASVLTGRNSHNIGAGQITEAAAGFPGYTGTIPKSAATVAKVLSGYGYDTAAFGKWHNTPVNNLFKTGPFDQYPTGLGFSYFYGFIAAETSQYEPRLFENTNPIEPPYTPEEGYHLTEDLADQAIKFIRNNRALTPDRPFFIYFAPGGTHGPHHVHSEWADKYKGKFDMGWEKLRNITFQKQKAMGWIPPTTELTEIDPTMEKWENISEKERAFQLRLVEVYAGYLEHTDTQDGKVIEELERQGLFNNTLVIYILGDNGASAEGLHGSIDELIVENGLPATAEQQIEILERDFGGLSALGSKHVHNMYHSSWAWALDTPFKSTKLVAAHFGGTRTPMVMSWPRVIKHDPIPRSQFHHVCDVVPTIYEAIGIKAPEHVEGATQMPLDGVSMVYTWNNASAVGRKDTQYFEVMGSRGVYKDGWFASVFGPRIPWTGTNATRLKEWNPDTDVWELYDLTKDYSQARDLAKEMPEQVNKMKGIFLVEAQKNKVLPVGAGLWTIAYHPEQGPKSPLTEWFLYEGMTRIAESNAPLFRTGFSSIATLDVEVAKNASGVLYCVGGTAGGFSVYMDQGYLYAEYMATLLYRYITKSSAPLKEGNAKIEIKLQYESQPMIAPAQLTMLVDGALVASLFVEKSMRLAFDASETFDVGMDLGSPVSLLYQDRVPFKYNGKINQLHVKYINGTAVTSASALLI
ncbi:putative sulfatase PB10D8.02c [Symbiodinium microadriaticum]|uniref:Putative sulfatase PB10D8.02c n=1 Tax=Symbiodinium microadriaticum TaxID=2951 RepID=A0A1Q9EXI3_SYMMI|nr:putative sulfatase PB10D8.02c [Symbiodinium microadriaticum]